MVIPALLPELAKPTFNKMLTFRLARSLWVFIRRHLLTSKYICSPVHRMINRRSWKRMKRDTRRVILAQWNLKRAIAHQIMR
jgi:hypothetical protein